MSDKPLKKCPDCSGKVQKLISRSSFHLKGSGWYATDYAAKSASSSTGQSSADKGLNKTKAKKEKASSGKPDTAGSKSE